MANQQFITKSHFIKTLQQNDFAPVVTFGPSAPESHHNTSRQPSLVMMVLLMLAGFALGHIARRGRDFIREEYWRVVSSFIGQMVIAVTGRVK